jgi:phenylacetate-CoA ligase
MPEKERAGFLRRILRETVQYAYEQAPAARKKMDEAGVQPKDIQDVADLVKIPLTRKADLKNIQKAELPFGGLAAVPPRGMRRIYVSPGPTFDPEGREQTHWRWEKAFVAAGFRPGDIVQNTFTYHFSPAGLMFEEGLIRIGCTVIPAGVGNTELQAQVLKDLRVTGYVGTPSFLMTLLEKAKEMGIVPGDGLQLKGAGRRGDASGIAARASGGIQDPGPPSVRHGGSSGRSATSVGSEGDAHQRRDRGGADRPASGRQVAPRGDRGSGHDPSDLTYPLIRFATGDLSIYTNDPCPCGRTSSRLVRIVGRVDQVTKVKGMFVHPEQVAQLEKKVPEIVVAQLVISRTGHDDKMTIRVLLGAGDLPSDALRERIAETARDLTRLRGEVVFVQEAEITEREKKILDTRKWD